ncbi:hypothetical protein CF327_g3485 [Tilletia walkeri]|nr:hypothetical protein CF327_g3485 [Tilletia walkeri]
MSEGNGTNGRSAGRSANPWLIDHDELPGWAADNHFIVTGHRRPGGWTKDKREAAKKKNGDGTTNGKAEADVQDMAAYEHSTFYRCWRSMWAYWHNETVNIHTHFWGALFSISLLVFHLQHLLMPSLTPALPLFIRYLSHAPIFYPASLSFSTANNAPALGKDRAGQAGEWLSMAHVPTEYSHPPDTRDIAGFGSFFIGAVLCLGFSATFHCCSCHSKKISASFNKLDYIGIVFMIVGSFLPALHYGFYCHPQLQMLYTTMIVGLGGMTMYAVVNPIYATPAYRPMRAKLFISLGLSAVFPVVHVCTMYGYQTVSRIMGLSYVIASGAMYIIGACMYAARIPERFAPGRFDLLGASHQLFHIFILFAAFAHYISLRQSYAFWHSVEHISGAAAAVGAHGWVREQVCSLLEAHRRG